MQVHELDNTTKHSIAVAFRRHIDGERSAIGTQAIEDTVLTLAPGINTVTPETFGAFERLRSKSKLLQVRLAKGEIVVRSRNATRSELEDKIRRCSDVETLKRWRSAVSAKDKGLLSLIEDQLAACTTTTSGKITDVEVKRDPEDPTKGGL